MSNLLNPDNAFFSFVSKAIDMLVLNILWAVLSVPLPLFAFELFEVSKSYIFLLLVFLTIIPIAPATTALYYAVVKVIRRERSYAIREFFHSFKQNFRQGAILSLILGLLVAVMYVDFQYAFSLLKAQDSKGDVFLGFFLVIALLLCTMLVYLCPILSRFEMKIGGLFKMAFVMGAGHFLTTLLLIVIFAAVLLGSYLFVPGVIIFPVIGMWLSSFLIERVFKKYMPAKEETEEGKVVDAWYLE